MKIVIAGGTGYIGTLLCDYYKDNADEIVILSRSSADKKGNVSTVQWDARTPGPWINRLEDTDLLINLAGKYVNCRYTAKNRREILYSRTDATRLLGKAVASLKNPPLLWIQSSSATIYRHSETKMMTEEDGEFGTGFSEEVCKQWEQVFLEQKTDRTRKVLLRTGIVLGRNESALPRMINLALLGMGGTQGSGSQYVSWIHEQDVVRSVEWIRVNTHLRGVFNCTSPDPVSNRKFMYELRKALGCPWGMNMPRWLLTLGAWVIGTEAELILKSRKVYPQRLLDNGFVFEFAVLNAALRDLCRLKRRIN